MEGCDCVSKRCPIYGSTVLYLDCLECEQKICRGEKNGKAYGAGSKRSYNDDVSTSIRHAKGKKDGQENNMDDTWEV